MSMISCDRCADPIDSDEDPDCFIEAPTCIPYNKNLEEVVCESCREKAWEQANERAMEDAC